MTLVLDTGVLYAAIDAKQPEHEVCLELLTTEPERLLIPDTVLVELDYLVRKTGTPKAWQAFVDDVVDGVYALYPLSSITLSRAAELEAQYADLRLGLVDSAVFAVCEELGEDRVATLDRRHFTVLRTRSGAALRLLPE